MKIYCLCTLNRKDGQSVEFKLACRDDAHAREEGDSIASVNDVEVWQDSRLVTRIKAKTGISSH